MRSIKNSEIGDFKPECDTCTALCCRNIPNEYQIVFCLSGTSICKHLDQTTNKCTIYQERPLICNVTEYHNCSLKLANGTSETPKINKDEWYEINYQSCKRLKDANKQSFQQSSTISTSG